MNSLAELNNYNLNLSIIYRDQRNAGINFTTLAPVDQTIVVKEGFSHIVPLGIEIDEIIEGDLLNVRFIIDTSGITTGGTVEWPVIPEGCTVSNQGKLYTINGITTKEIWDQVKSPIIHTETTPVSPEDYNYWAAIFYNPDAEKIWTITLIMQEAINLYTRFESYIRAGAQYQFKSVLESKFDMFADGKLAVMHYGESSINSNFTILPNGRLGNQQASSSVSSNYSMYAKSFNIRNDLSFTIDALSTNHIFTTTFGYVPNSGMIIVNWGDGTYDSYPTTDNNTLTITKTFTTTGLKTIVITSPGPGALTSINLIRDDLIRINQWGEFQFTNINVSSFNLTSVPSYIPTTSNLIMKFANCPKLNDSNIRTWNTANITDMSEMFRGCYAFNQPLNTWNVSNVTNMNAMFQNAGNFNQPLNNWNTAKVTNMKEMFQECIAFNGNITTWNTSSVTDMSEMFYGCTAFNQSLNTWNVSNVTNMSWMFGNATNFNQPMNNWNVSNVIFMQNMFTGCTAFNQPLNNWNTSSVTDMRSVFYGCTAFNGDITTWNTSSVTNMRQMFRNASNFNQPLNTWNVSNVNNMSGMFQNTLVFNQPLNNWITSSVTDMSSMFADTLVFNQPLDTWNVSNVTNMSAMFQNSSKFNQPLNNWNTANVTNMSAMFQNSEFDNQQLYNWNTSKVTNMSYMFYGCQGFYYGLSYWDVSNVTNMSYMFASTLYWQESITSWNTVKVTNMISMFQNAKSFNYNLSAWHVPLILSKPSNFDAGATAWTLPRPVWGNP